MGICSLRKGIDARNDELNKKMDCTICVAKTKALISCAITAQLICAFVVAKAILPFSHDESNSTFSKCL